MLIQFPRKIDFNQDCKVCHSKLVTARAGDFQLNIRLIAKFLHLMLYAHTENDKCAQPRRLHFETKAFQDEGLGLRAY